MLPELKGKLDGISMRVPTPNVSCVDLAAVLEHEDVTAEEVNAALQKAADGPLKGILACSDEELVSIDFKGNPHSSIVDAPYTKVMDGDFVKVLSWYDNEWGYSNRCVDLLRKLVAEGSVARGFSRAIMKLSIRDLDLKGQRVFIRVDFNVPLKNGVIGDDTRIRASLPTIQLRARAGRDRRPRQPSRPAQGQAESRDEPASRSPTGWRELLGRPVAFAADCIGDAARRNAHTGGVVLLENLRFHPEEEKNDPAFAKALASLADALRERRVRRGAPRARVGRGDHARLRAARGRAADGEGAPVSRARARIARAAVRRDPRRREGVGQDRRHPRTCSARSTA